LKDILSLLVQILEVPVWVLTLDQVYSFLLLLLFPLPLVPVLSCLLVHLLDPLLLYLVLVQMLIRYVDKVILVSFLLFNFHAELLL
jgi:hypothetical protein